MALVAAGCAAAETTRTAVAPARSSGRPVDLRELVPADRLDRGPDVNTSGSTWSPDGEWIAFVDDMNTHDVWIVRRDGTGARQLTKGHER